MRLALALALPLSGPLSGGCAHLRPPPPEELGTPASVSDVNVGLFGEGMRFDGVEVHDLITGGFPVAQSVPGGGDRLFGSFTLRFRLTEDGAPFYRVACRAEFPEDPGGPRIEHVCLFEPARTDLASMRLVLAAPLDSPLQGVVLRADEIVATVEGTSRLPFDPRPSKTTGVLLRHPVSAHPLAFVTTTGDGDQVYAGEALTTEDRRALRPTILALVTALDPRNGFEDWCEGDDCIDAFRPAPSSNGADVDEEERAGSQEDDAPWGLAADLRPDLARALARAEEQSDGWPDRPLEPVPMLGPDLRPGMDAAFVLVDALFALSVSNPLDTPGGPSFGWLFAVGVDLFDFVDLYGALDLTPRHPLGDDVELDRGHVPRIGLGTRVNLVRFDPVRVFVGFEGGLTPNAGLGRNQVDVAQWGGTYFGPTAGARVRLAGGRLGGGGVDLRIEGTWMREIWTLDEARIGGLAERVERWAPGLRTVVQIKL